jgi:hypothetical protein
MAPTRKIPLPPAICNRISFSRSSPKGDIITRVKALQRSVARRRPPQGYSDPPHREGA